MGETVRLAGGGGLAFDAWREPAREARRGGLVVLHASSGVTPHLHELAAEWADTGWEVLVPSLLDRDAASFPGADGDHRAAAGSPGADADPGRRAGRRAPAAATGWGDATTPRVQAAVDVLAPSGAVCVMGFGFGAAAAWLAACRCEGVAAASAFYGDRIADVLDEAPRAPTILHFGRRDARIPPADVARITHRHPDVPVYLYDAGHAFVAADSRHADSARLALLRTRALFHRAAGGRDHGA